MKRPDCPEEIFTHKKSSFSFSVSTAASGHEGVGGDVSEVLLGPSEHKQLIAQNNTLTELLRRFLGPRGLRSYQGLPSPPS